MELGNFSLSLAVKDLQASKDFYEALGFTVFFGEVEQNWLILKNGNATIGLFQGMFKDNIMTFNPGWNENAQPVEQYTDVREIQATLKKQGITPVSEVETETGRGSFMIKDPDGNTILIDQHV